MQDHRSDRWPARVAHPGTPEFEHQRRLLLELAVEPPVDGDRPADLARTLGLAPEALDAAADALVAAGLALRRGGRLFPSPVTMALDALWPIAL
jgi:hypothetical protein